MIFKYRFHVRFLYDSTLISSLIHRIFHAEGKKIVKGKIDTIGKYPTPRNRQLEIPGIH